MGTVWRHLGWLLLVPEPSEEVRRRASVWLLLAAGVAFVIFGLLRILQTPPDFSEALRYWALALLSFVQALLCSPSLNGRPWAMLGARAVVSSVYFAVMGVVAATSYADGFPLGEALAAAFLAFILCCYYVANRRKYRRSRPA